LSHPAGFTSNVQCVCLAAGQRTQAGDATDQWRDQCSDKLEVSWDLQLWYYYKFSPDAGSEIILKIFGKVEAYKKMPIFGPPCRLARTSYLNRN